MACGLPCIASRLAGSTDAIIDDRLNGLLVPAGEPQPLAAGLMRLVEDSALRTALGDAARATVARRFANVDVADRWLTAYQSFGSRPRT
jgi:glycosyltransferase involved in cell wall biosynthesis